VRSLLPEFGDALAASVTGVLVVAEHGADRSLGQPSTDARASFISPVTSARDPIDYLEPLAGAPHQKSRIGPFPDVVLTDVRTFSTSSR
jgi:hypothetical protein